MKQYHNWQAYQGIKRGKNLIQFLFILVFSAFIYSESYSEGSGTWGTAADRQSMLWLPSSRSAGEGWFTSGYNYRGFMMMPSQANATNFSGYNANYNPHHRLFVYVKAGETVFWGFRFTAVRRRDNSYSEQVRVRWFYDSNDTGLFPAARTAGQGRTMISGFQYNSVAAGGAAGRPNTANAAAIGPNQITGQGYTALTFTNNTGQDRAFWIEVTDESDEPIWYGANIDFWDVTVASGSSGNYTERRGRLYCKFWSIANSRSNKAATANSPTFSVASQFAFHDDFGFYVPVDNTFSPAPNDYFVKRITFPAASGGWTNFFANQDGPRSHLSYEENRRSLPNDPVTNQPPPPNIQYPLFLNDPDNTVWLTTEPPTASLDINYDEKPEPLTGGEATVDLTVSLPAVVDILIDLNGNGVFDEGIDILLSRNFDSPGTFQIYWNGEDSSGNELESGAEVDFYVAVIFFPVHFPIYDLEVSEGILVRNVRPGTPDEINDIYWDDSLVPRTGPGITGSPQSVPVNVTGVPSPDHIWTATGDNGFGNNVTINTWAASYYSEIRETTGFSFHRIYGNVFDDENGLEDNLISGPNTGLTNLRVVLINEENRVVRFAPVNEDGTFTLMRVPNGNLSIMLTIRSTTFGAVPPEKVIPSAWENVGENFGAGPGHDGTVDGILTGIVIDNATVHHANFGIRRIKADLSALKFVDTSTPEVGTEVVFTIIVGNDGYDGYSTARNVQLEENMPPGYQYVSHTVSRGEYDPISNIWQIGELLRGESEMLTITALVLDHTEYENTVVVSSDSNEVNLSNNTASASTEPFIILPVNWLFFQGENWENKVKLQWATAMEKDNKRFIVQKSYDARSWSDIDKVIGQGTTDQQTFYESWDKNPTPGPNYYRLIQEDLDSKINFSDVIRVDFVPGWRISVYPNPHRERFLIESNDLEALQIKLFDLSGKELPIHTIINSRSSYSVDTSGISKGVYLLQVVGGNINYKKKILKN
jgi:uncharacterized repeat protein (TIGR01451 family)